MNLRKQDWFRIAVSIAGLGVLVYNTPEFIDYYVNGGEETMYYIAVPFLYIAIIGFAAGAVWEIWKRQQDV